MAVSRSRERRPALWPYLVMPLIVLILFYALNQLRQHSRDATPVSSAAGDVHP